VATLGTPPARKTPEQDSPLTSEGCFASLAHFARGRHAAMAGAGWKNALPLARDGANFKIHVLPEGHAPDTGCRRGSEAFGETLKECAAAIGIPGLQS